MLIGGFHGAAAILVRGAAMAKRSLRHGALRWAMRVRSVRTVRKATHAIASGYIATRGTDNERERGSQQGEDHKNGMSTTHR